MSHESAPLHPSPRPAGRRALTLTGLALVVVAVAALESFLLPALPHLQKEFGVDAATGALATVAPTVTTVIVTPLAGRFADVFGAKRTLAVLVCLVIAGGLVSAFAPVFGLFVVGQVLQGFGLGILPVSFVVIAAIFDSGSLKVASGVIVAMTVAGAGLGVLVAGPIVENLSRAVLFAAPVAIVIAGAIAFFAARPSLAVAERGAPTRIDWAGSLLLAVALVATVGWLGSLAAAGPFAPVPLVLLIVAVGAVASWIAVERTVAQPMIDVRTLRTRAVGGAVTVGLFIGAAYGVVVYLVPQQIAQSPATGYGLGASATETGFFLAAAFGIAVIASPLAGVIARRVGTTVVGVVGMGVLAAGALVAAVSTQPIAIVVALLFAGIGASSASTAVFASAAGGAGEHEVGVSTALVTIARALGSALATQSVAAILASGAVGGVPDLAGLRVAFLIGAVLAAIGAFLSLALPRAARPAPLPAISGESA
ncbi:MFS transporter [Leifsonia naganoensis]|uniref:MFS family permease n=1 Tax=Leifsonia naganoensis TaxID=150025 RepID=A0A853DN38_9MICO|nr:MFS family permease [Leifsonia naganoensis]